MAGTIYFSKSWLNDDKYKDWIIENLVEYKTFKCKLCNPCKVMNLSNMGVNALISHMKSEKHKRSIKVKSLFKPKNRPLEKHNVKSRCRNKCHRNKYRRNLFHY